MENPIDFEYFQDSFGWNGAKKTSIWPPSILMNSIRAFCLSLGSTAQCIVSLLKRLLPDDCFDNVLQRHLQE